jgi:hypothetical protein
VRGFCRLAPGIRPRHPGPPEGLLPGRNHRPTRYLYSGADIAVLMATARSLPPSFARPLRDPHRAARGDRPAHREAMHLDRDDVDWDAAAVREGFQIRKIPGGHGASQHHRSPQNLLAAPGPALRPTLGAKPVRLDPGNPPHPLHDLSHLRRLLGSAGIQERSPSCRPHVHSLRHSFTASTLHTWYRAQCAECGMGPEIQGSTFSGSLSTSFMTRKKPRACPRLPKVVPIEQSPWSVRDQRDGER